VVCRLLRLHNTGWAKKNAATDSRPYFYHILADFFKKITEKFLGKFAVKWTLKIPPHLAYVATLPGSHYLVKRYCQQNRPLTANYKAIVATY